MCRATTQSNPKTVHCLLFGNVKHHTMSLSNTKDPSSRITEIHVKYTLEFPAAALAMGMKNSCCDHHHVLTK